MFSPSLKLNLQLQLSAENSQFSANDVAEDGLQPTGGQSESSHAENGTTTYNSPLFSAEVFRQRFEEAYDLHDEEYNFWLRINHPDDLPSNHSSVANFFPDVQPLSSVSTGNVLNDVNSSSILSSGFRPSDSSSPSITSSSSSVLPLPASVCLPPLPCPAAHQ